MKEMFEKLLLRLTPEKRRRLIVVLGAAGLALIFLSSLLPEKTDASPDLPETPPSQTEAPSDDYRKTLETELCAIVSKIDGAGEVNVMITMDTTAEDVFAVDKTESVDRNAASGNSEIDTRRSEENEYVIVKDSDGSERTVLKKQRMPEIRGVLVVCSGGGSAVTKEKITEAVAGALGIARSKIVVTK